MNIKITKKEFDYLITREVERSLFGSRLFETNRDDSDTDIMIIYEDFGVQELFDIIPSQHQFQYDSVTNNRQYVFTTFNQYWQNLYSGDSTINSDILMFNNKFSDERKLNVLYSFKIIKAYLGFAKRDLSNLKGRNKLFHVKRGLYVADKLLDLKLPNKEDLKKLAETDNDLKPDYYLKLEKELRAKLHDLHSKNLISDYNFNEFSFDSNDENEVSLVNKLLIGINTREFKY